MSYDGLVTRAVTFEIKKLLLGAKIQKISQPSKNDIILNIYSFGKTYKLLLSANNNEARVHITEKKYENPVVPPNFCMVLRKHLSQSKIIGIDQYKLDRVIVFKISSVDEMGFDVSNKLIVEIMGKYSNIILTDDKYKIIDSIKRVNFKMSSVREILPGLEYKFIESDKINIDNGVYIFLAPPSLSELKNRIVNRGTETESDINLRMSNAKKELSYIKNYDYLVVNDHLNSAINLVNEIINAEKHRVIREDINFDKE